MVFSVANAILLRPLPGIADPGRLVLIYRVQDGNVFDNLGYPDYADHRDQSRSLAALAAHCPIPLTMTRDRWLYRSFSSPQLDRLSGGGARRPPFEVIGVAADAKYLSLIADAPLLMYSSLIAEYDNRTHILVRTAADPTGVLWEIEQVARDIDKDGPVYRPETMAVHTAESLWQRRTAASWVGAFSLMALILAAVGLYGVIAQSVAQRTRELGMRVALGAAPGSISRLVIREGMTLALIGTAVGLPIALASERMMGHLPLMSQAAGETF